jgi:hypothetical protein
VARPGGACLGAPPPHVDVWGTERDFLRQDGSNIRLRVWSANR